MAGVVRKIFRSLAYILATVVILMALMVGLVRLLLPLVPDYQEEVRLIAAQTTGFDVEFERISASWPLQGPALSLFQVRLLEPDTGQQVLAAEEVSLGLNILRLFSDGLLVPSRLALHGATVDIQRSTANSPWRVQGLSLDQLLPAMKAAPRQIPDIDLRFEDIHLNYRDAEAPAGSLSASLPRVRLSLGDDQVQVEGRVNVLGEEEGRFNFSAVLDAAVLDSGTQFSELDWSINLDGDDVDLPRLLNLALRDNTPLVFAQGNLAIDARLRGFKPMTVAARMQLRDLQLSTGGAADASYDEFGGGFEWESSDNGWLLALNDLQIARQGDTWPSSSLVLRAEKMPGGEQRFSLKTAYLRLQDLYPLVLASATSQARGDLLPADIAGEVRDVDISIVTVPDAAPRYRVAGEADRVGLVDGPGGFTGTGISGVVEADQDGGRLEINTLEAEFRVPELFANRVRADELSGFLVWRVADDAIRILSDSFSIRAPQLVSTSRFEVTLPRDGSSPRLDLDADAQVGGPQALAFLPVGKLPTKVGQWLRRALVAGKVSDAKLRFDGALSDWPFTRDEGVFRVDVNVQDAIFDYAPDWPRVENISGQFVFDGVSLSTVKNSGRLAGMPVRNIAARIPDLRKGIIEIEGEQRLPLNALLGLLRNIPPAREIRPSLERLRATGEIDARFDLRIPALRPRNYRLAAQVSARGNELAVGGLEHPLTNIKGILRVRNTRLDADRLDAQLLGEPVQIKLRSTRQDRGAYGHHALLSSQIPAALWMDTLKLPYSSRVTGAPDLHAVLLVPAQKSDRKLRVLVHSDLVGVDSTLPEPLRKSAASPLPLYLDIDFPAAGVTDIKGNLQRSLHWALRMESRQSAWRIDRMALHSGSDDATMPQSPGIEISGRLPRLHVGDWLSLSTGKGRRGIAGYRPRAISIDELSAFGYVFRDTSLLANRLENSWQIEVDGKRARGRITIPDQASIDDRLVLNMQRLQLVESASDAGEGGLADPRSVPPIRARIENFRIQDWRFGQLLASIDPIPAGVVASRIDINGGPFIIDGDADWRLVNDDLTRQRSSLRLNLRSSNVAQTLERFGYGPIMEGPMANANAALSWSGPPSADFLDAASGTIRFKLEEGTLKKVDPGGGRLLGILSVSALPRRLSLDFSDVTDEGLSFDELQGDFNVEGGNAYTCNLGLVGSVADLGVVGRIGMRDKDYDQLAVVRPHVSNVMPIGGAIVGGPGLGAAVLLIQQIFRKPLSKLGETYYQILGPWDSYQVKKVQRSDVDVTRFKDCERYLAEVLPKPIDGADMQTEPGSELPPEIIP